MDTTYTNMHKDAAVALIEYQTIAGTTSRISANEWWNGEGINFDIDEKLKFALHMDEICMVAAHAHAMGMLDLKEVKKISRRLQGVRYD